MKKHYQPYLIIVNLLVGCYPQLVFLCSCQGLDVDARWQSLNASRDLVTSRHFEMLQGNQMPSRPIARTTNVCALTFAEQVHMSSHGLVLHRCKDTLVITDLPLPSPFCTFTYAQRSLRFASYCVEQPAVGICVLGIV